MKVRPDLFSGILAFVRTAEERSFGRAARSLGVTTAATSKAVRRLEDDLGVKLLDRSSRVVAPTREGALFLERCQPAVEQVQGAREAVEGRRRVPEGEVSITLPFIVAPLVMPVLARIGEQHPRLSFRVDVSDRVSKLARERYDLAIRTGDLPPSSLVTRVLRSTRWVTVASPLYLARRPAPREPEDLRAHNCLVFVAPNGRPRHWSFDEGGGEVRRDVEGNLRIDHGTSLLSAALAGMGICQVLDFMVTAPLRDGQLVEVLAEQAAAGPAIHALATPGRVRSANVRAVVEQLVAAFRQRGNGPSPAASS